MRADTSCGLVDVCWTRWEISAETYCSFSARALSSRHKFPQRRHSAKGGNSAAELQLREFAPSDWSPAGTPDSDFKLQLSPCCFGPRTMSQSCPNRRGGLSVDWHSCSCW